MEVELVTVVVSSDTEAAQTLESRCFQCDFQMFSERVIVVLKMQFEDIWLRGAF